MNKEDIEKRKYLKSLTLPPGRMTDRRLHYLLQIKGDLCVMQISALGLFCALGNKVEDWEEWIGKYFLNNPIVNPWVDYFGEPEAYYTDNYCQCTISISYAKSIVMMSTNTRLKKRVYKYLTSWEQYWNALKQATVKSTIELFRDLSQGRLIEAFENHNDSPLSFIEIVARELGEEYTDFQLKTANLFS